MNKKYFDILKLNENASIEEVKLSYKNLINTYNSQLNDDNSNFNEINQKILEVNSAYDYLMNNVFNSSNNEKVLMSQIRNLINSNLLDEAREKLWKIENRNAEWNYLIGQVYYKEGWYDKSQSHFEIAYDLEPNNFEYSQAYNSFKNSNNQFRQTYSKRATIGDNSGCCCDTCCTLLCIDSCCECCGCDFISCC